MYLDGCYMIVTDQICYDNDGKDAMLRIYHGLRYTINVFEYIFTTEWSVVRTRSKLCYAIRMRATV